MNDTYGQEVRDYRRGKPVEEIVERSDGWIDVSMGPKTYFADYQDWPAYYKKALKHVRGKVLDIGCGAGRPSLYLQKKNFDVTGIDVSPLAIKVCRLRGLKKAKVMSIDGIGSFKKESFDTIMMMGNNFGLFGNFKKAKKLLKTMHRITSQNALIIADTLDPYDTNDPAHHWYHRYNKKHGRMGGQIKIRIRYKKCIGAWFDYLMVSKKEMKQIVEGTGWHVKNFVDSGKHQYITIIEKYA